MRCSVGANDLPMRLQKTTLLKSGTVFIIRKVKVAVGLVRQSRPGRGRDTITAVHVDCSLVEWV